MATFAKRPVFREIAAEVNGRRLIVGIHPNGYITVRLKGTRRTADATAVWIYRNREGIAKHQARLARRRARKEAAIAAQIEMALSAYPREASE
jgi:hypothetical protein